MKCRCAILFLLLLVAVAAFGQISSSFSTEPNGTFHGSATFRPPHFASRPVVGAPYYGEEVSEHVQTLANGAHVTQTDRRQKTWRDSQGRTRTERPIGMGVARPDAPTVIQITDQVAGYMYTLDAEKKVAHRVALAAPSGSSQSANDARMANRINVQTGTRGGGASGHVTTGSSMVAQRSDTQRPQVTTEALGTKTIDGVVTEGKRRTTLYPSGSQGNDAPFSVISENLALPDLKLTLLSTTDDPRNGVETQRIDNLSTQEPDPTLFILPSGYTISFRYSLTPPARMVKRPRAPYRPSAGTSHVWRQDAGSGPRYANGASAIEAALS